MIRYALLIVCLLVAACSEQKKSEPYDDVRGKLIFDLFSSVEKGDHQSTFKSLTRLKALISHDLFLDELYAKENNNVALIKADQALAAGDLDTASMQAASAEARGLQQQIQALRIVEAYLKQKPFPSSERAYKALDTLDSTNEVFAKVPAYANWVVAEKKLAAELYRKEYEALLAEALRAYSKKLVASASYTKFCLAHVDKKKIEEKEVENILASLCTFNPDLKKIKIADFRPKVNSVDNQAMQTLRTISGHFVAGRNKEALSLLSKFVEETGKVSWALQKTLMQRSEKLKRVVAGDKLILLDDVITKFEEAEAIDRKLKKKEKEERLKQEEELRRKLEEIRKKAEQMTTE